MTTHTTTEVVCDRCDARAELFVRDGKTIELPFRWIHVTRERGETADVMDLCPDCADSFEAWRVSAERVA